MSRVAFLITAVVLLFPAATSGAVGGYAFDGGTKTERATVVAALEASSFDWTLLPGPITIHIVRGEPSRSLPREVWLDADLLDSGEFAWGVVQHEYAHQVDYLLLDDAQRALLLRELGGRDWCYSVPGLAHDQYGCERFASTLAWSFWPSVENSMRPTHPGDESAAMAPARFRALVTRLTSRPLSRRSGVH
ncbi:MAG TPA: hypothetical protein VIM33_07870 [Gaiellaceae bacterium]